MVTFRLQKNTAAVLIQSKVLLRDAKKLVFRLLGSKDFGLMWTADLHLAREHIT